ncbi:MAG: bifunctional methylenetetrahydrofolate dehydrogenase/methenyltetrahydrofolate cyclohydrolase FolD [Acidobacteria bacterium]|nr:bifunctional methylenetetrahydrofolate dehydrogenase/methenyltetrahydrofolate cyclohydrolase FolD [Acidobacteriota bacterium]
MTAEWIDGVAIGEAIKAEVARDVEILRERGIVPGLTAVLVGEHPASKIYVRNKVKASHQLGIRSEQRELDASVTSSGLLRVVDELNQRDDVDGILVQLPLPGHVDAKAILRAVSPDKDVDGFHPLNVGRLCIGAEGLRPCTPVGILEMLRRSGVPLQGTRAVVVGRSDIVGKPLALLLLHQHATVTICHSRTRNLPQVCREADLLVAAMGKPGMITSDYVRPGAVVVDVGINRVSEAERVADYFGDDPARMEDFQKKGYALVGDVHPRSVKRVASRMTPVPGGVGPLTIAMLMSNTVRAAKLRRGLQV